MNSRAEVDGLKALAVLFIVLFHYDVAVAPGGFVCLDVALVTCGFLTTSALQAEISAGAFTFLAYYARGMRRLLPALFVLLAFALGAGFLLMRPPEFAHLAKSGAFASLLSSNVFFSIDSSSFNPNSSKLPLLNTWPVSCFAQFYVVLPVLILALHKASKRVALAVLIALVIASFMFSLWYLDVRRTAAFYMLPSRLWELLIGSALALAPRPKARPALASVVGLCGLAMILVAVIKFNQWTLYPGKRGLLPVLGAAAMIYSFSLGEGVVARVLAWKPIAFVGKISLSWFLWHWPLIAFYKYLQIDGAPWAKMLLMATSFGLAVLSWRFIEQPFLPNRGIDQRPLRPLLAGVGVSATAAAAFAFAALMAGDQISPDSVKSVVASQSR